MDCLYKGCLDSKDTSRGDKTIGNEIPFTKKKILK